jgi:hypothetical protein
VGGVERLVVGRDCCGLSGQSVMLETAVTESRHAKEIMGLVLVGPECIVRSGFGRVKEDADGVS